MGEMKVCRFGDDCESKRLGIYPTAPLMPATEEYFSKYYGRPGETTDLCKRCRSKRQTEINNRPEKDKAPLVGNTARTSLISALENQEIPARAVGRGMVEAGGIARIKIKAARLLPDGVGWHLNNIYEKSHSQIDYDLIAVVLLNEDYRTLHTCIFLPTHEAFFNRDGNLFKFSVQILLNPKHRKEGYRTLTMEDVRKHENDWRLVETTIANLCTHLPNGGLKEYRRNRARYIPVNTPKPGNRVRPFIDKAG